MARRRARRAHRRGRVGPGRTTGIRARRVRQALFCVVVFCATAAARRFGPRGATLGLLAFMSYFFSLFARTGTGDFRVSSLSILVSVAVAFVVRFAVVRDRPERVLDRMLDAFHARATALLESIARAAEAPGDGRWRAHRVRVSVARLNDAALALEDEAAARHRRSPAGAWALDVFAVALAIETTACVVADARAEDAPPEVERELARFARRLGAIVRGPAGAGGGPPTRPGAASPMPLSGSLGARMRFAARVLESRHPWTAPPPADTVIDENITAAGGSAPLGPNPDAADPEREPVRPTLRLAIQAAIAAAVAMLAGHPVSSARWYWAVVGAFVVFMRATNRAESVSRAWQRILGTVGGVALGVVGATRRSRGAAVSPGHPAGVAGQRPAARPAIHAVGASGRGSCLCGAAPRGARGAVARRSGRGAAALRPAGPHRCRPGRAGRDGRRWVAAGGGPATRRDF